MGRATPSHLDDLPLAAAMLDGDLRVLTTNAAFDDLIGAPPEAGLDVIELLSGVAETVERTGGAPVFQLHREHQDRWMRLDLHRRGEAVAAILVDISAERQALEELRFAYATRDRLMADANIGGWRFDPDHQVYAYTEEAAAGGAEQIALRSVVALQHPADSPKDAEVRERLSREGGVGECEIRFSMRGSRWTHQRIHYRSGRRTASGLYEIYGLAQDITALAHVRDAAAAAAERLQLALKTARAGVFEVDFAARRFFPSPEFLAMVAEDAQQDGPGRPLPFFHPGDRAELMKLYTRAREELTAGSVDVRLNAPDGERWVRLFLEVQDDGLRGVGLMLDIDEQKRQENALTEARQVAEAATAAKSNFLASMSHEIRTPMNGIVGVLNLLRSEPMSVDARHLLHEALGCSEMLSQLINDVLDFSKIEALKLDLSPAPADALAIVRSVTSLLATQAEAKGVTLTVDPRGDMGGAFLDPVRLRQCLFNVIGNAVKFTERGRVEVRLEFQGQGEARRLRCEVEDTGVGVPEAARPHLFDRFHQADGGTTRRFGGTGLGLAITKSLAEMMGGDMGFESVEGVGSTFWFEVSAPPAEARRPVADTAFAGAPLEGLRILVADDNATNRLVVTKSLEALGAEAEAVENGREAIAAVGAGGFDLILMDINMPDMDGLEAARRIRALPAPASRTPIIAHTADVMNHQRAGYEAAGMDGVVSKPFSPAQLVAEIARLAQADDPLEAGASTAA